MALQFDRVEQMMKIQKLTQKELLQKAGQSPNNFSRWKKGESSPSYSSVASIASALGTTPEYLLGYSNSPFGEDAIENGMEKLLDAGAEIDYWDDDNGVGQEYAVTWKGHTVDYHENGFKELCRKMLTWLSDKERENINQFCDNAFSGSSIKEDPTPYGLSAEEADFLARIRRLSPDGKIKILSALIDEERRITS